MKNIENKLLEWKSFFDSVEIKGAFHLLELAGQFNHISNGMHTLNDSLYATFRTLLSECAILKNSKHQVSVLQIDTIHLRIDRSGLPVLTNGKYSNLGVGTATDVAMCFKQWLVRLMVWIHLYHFFQGLEHGHFEELQVNSFGRFTN